MVVDVNRILVIVGCAVSTILFITCVAGDVWVKSTVEIPVSSNKTHYTVMHYGIWTYCFQDGECHDIGDAYALLWKVTPTWLQAVRILSCLATLLEAFGTINGIAGVLRESISQKESKICLLLGPFFMIIALSIFTGYIGPVPHGYYEWGWSFIIGWLATCLTPVYGVFAIS